MDNDSRAERRLTTSDLISGRGPTGARDKVYMAGKVMLGTDDSSVAVYLGDEHPVVWLNDKYRTTYGHPSDLTVPELQRGANPALMLISSGVFLWAGDRLVTLRRDAAAPSYAGHLTEPAGRCDDLPGLTALRELNEELCISSADASLALLYDGYLLADTAGELKQAQSTYGTLVEYVALNQHESTAQCATLATVYVNGKPRETVLGPHVLDVQNNTLEIRLALDIPNSYKDLRFRDGETYNREIVLATPGQLAAGQPMTPALEHYVRRLIIHAQEKDGAELPDLERQACEVWTRVMGYHRPVTSFNEGKQAEFAERTFFREALVRPKLCAEKVRLPPDNATLSPEIRLSPSATSVKAASGPLRVYMAGPLFTLAERNHNVALAAAISRLMPGTECVLPQVRTAALLPDLQAVVEDCTEQASVCDVTVACLDGPDADSGTCMEIAYARSNGRLIVGYRTDLRDSEADGLNAMVRYGLHAYIRMPSSEATVERLARAIVGQLRARFQR